jgi:SHS2 domain-containing protein
MRRNYKFIDHTADIAVELKGDSLEELFIAGAEAWLVSVTDDIKSEANDLLDINLSAVSKEELLVTFLNELNFFLITKKWLCLSIQSIKIVDDSEGWGLSAELNGIKIENDIQLKQEIKSVTYHQMEIVEMNGNYSTRVVFDI